MDGGEAPATLIDFSIQLNPRPLFNQYRTHSYRQYLQGDPPHHFNMSSTSTPTIIDLRGSTKETESSYIEGSSRESYTATLVLLIMFLFDSSRKEILFSQDALAKFEAAHNKDKGKTDRRNLRKAAKEVIGKLGNPSYCPIIVDKITYSEDISAFMNSKKKIVQVHKDLADEWRQSKGISRKSKRKANTKGKSTKSTKRVRHDTAEEEGEEREEREEEELEEEETDTEDEAEVEAEVEAPLAQLERE